MVDVKLHVRILVLLVLLTLGSGANLDPTVYLGLPKDVIGDIHGAPCMADGYPGTCIHWKRCFTLILDVRDKKYPPLCWYDRGEPVICCTGCNLVKDVSKIVLNPRGGLLWRTDQESWNQCINYYLDLDYEWKTNELGKIDKVWNGTQGCFSLEWGVVGAAGGRDATRTEFPHMALLGYGTSKQNSQWLCGGTLISDRFILTAGHCAATAYGGPVRYAALGILKRSDPKDLWQIYRIQSIILHPMYHPPSKYHDIALLKTTRRISFNKNAMPACLPRLDAPADDGDALATGWGTTGPRTPPADTLQVVKLYKFSQDKCTGLYRKHRLLTQGYSHTTQMCYGDDHKVTDTCQGDSGGPLQISGQIYRQQRTVIGVTSYGPDCGYLGQAGMYTRVRPYVPWIDSVVWE